MDTKSMLTDHERRISHLEGKLDSLATKELVLSSNADLLSAMNEKFDQLSIKIDQQTAELRAELRAESSLLRGEIRAESESRQAESKELRDEMRADSKELRVSIQNLDTRINDQDKKYTKLAGAAVAIGLILSILVGAANVVVAAVSAGIMTL